MQRTTVTSDALLSVGYDPSNLVLELEFPSGKVYQYRNVPLTVYSGLMSAESHGTYFNTRIRPPYRGQEVWV